MDDLYQEQILDHWRHSPHRGSLEQPEAAAEGMNPLCGDALQITLRLRGGRVEAMKFAGQGCVISQAAASMLADLVEGRLVAEARDLDRQELLDELGIPLSPARLKCALLSLAVLRQALGRVPGEAPGEQGGPP